MFQGNTIKSRDLRFVSTFSFRISGGRKGGNLRRATTFNFFLDVYGSKLKDSLTKVLLVDLTSTGAALHLTRTRSSHQALHW